MTKYPVKEHKYTDKQARDLARPYVADALRFYNQEAGTKYKLVEPGYVTSAFLRTSILHHVNFTAKKSDVADAPEEMFFAELTTTGGGLENVQHPKTGGFSRGGRGLFPDGSGSSSSSDPEIILGDLPSWEYLVGEPSKECVRVVPRPYAAEAMSFYNTEAGTKYELVELGSITRVHRETSILHHFNFTAKKTDVADAPEEMFFVELTTTCGVLSLKRCICMGPRDSISGDENNGCCYCRLENVQHPKGGHFSRGGEGMFLDC
ncbi:hypothetical protein C5167_031124 [Papaver somniferum]|nr:hypothetical protein C5167_031124 [Papaver somniferum]